MMGASYPLLGLLVLLGALGAPFPLAVALAAAGALARQGQLSVLLLVILCTGAAVAGDCLGYAIGRYGIAEVCARRQGRFCTWLRRWLSTSGGQLGQHGTGLRMGMLVFLTRWAITAPSAVVNLVAGARRYRWEWFLFTDFVGEALWAAMSILQGYLLGGNGGLDLTLALAGGALLTVIGAVAGTVVLRRTGPGRRE
jgi:membrane protein DedA with SNARE-associated domain